MSKNNEKNVNPVTAEQENPSAISDVENKVEAVETVDKKAVQAENKKDKKVVDNKNKKNNNKKKDKKEKGKLKRKAKETISELKKVTWPSFGKTMKQTGMVLSVVLVFGLLVLGIDSLISLILKLINKI